MAMSATTGLAPPTIPLRALRAVAAVAGSGSVARAGEALHQSAAAITRAVQAAEQAAGVALFRRGARGMAPTPAGALVAQRAERAFQALEAAASGLRTRGAPPSVSALPRLMSDAMVQALVARSEHATEAAAAQALGLSQPALNQALRRLEHAAKTTLYERTRVGTRLNESGDWLLQHVKVALAEIRIALEEIAPWCGQGEPRISVGTLPMACDVLVPRSVQRVLSQRPGLRINVMDGTYESLLHLLRNAELDVMVGPLRGRGLADDLQEEALYVDRFVAVVRAGHPVLVRRRAPVLQRLAEFPWIGPLAGTPAQAAIDRLFAEAGLQPPPMALRTHSTTVVRSMLMATDHVALASPLQLHSDLQAGRLVCASAALHGTERVIGITQRKAALASTACADFISTMRAVSQQAISEITR